MKSFVSLLTLGALLLSGGVFADNRDFADKRGSAQRIKNHDTIRVHIPVKVRGPERLSLGRMINRQRHIDLDRYSLRAVVVNGSRGNTRLTVGRYSSPTVRLNRHEPVRIAAPARHGDHWRLHLTPGSKVRSITAILEPRRRYAHAYPKYGFNLGWLTPNTYDRHLNRDRHGPVQRSKGPALRHPTKNESRKETRKEARKDRIANSYSWNAHR